MKKFSDYILEKENSFDKLFKEVLFEGEKITSDSQFKKWAVTVLKKAHGDKYDEKKAEKVIDGLLKKYKDNYGAAVGALSYGLSESLI